MVKRLLIFALLAGCATAPKPTAESAQGPQCMFTEHMKMVTSDSDCYCTGCPSWVVSRAEHEAREDAWKEHCARWEKRNDCPDEAECEDPGEVSYVEGRCVAADGQALSEAPPRYREERLHPDAKIWSADQVAELHAHLNKQMEEGRYAAAYEEALKNSFRSETDGMLDGGLRREDYVSTMELAGRAAEYLDDNDKIVNIYFNLTDQFRDLGYESPRTELRLLTGLLLSNSLLRREEPKKKTAAQALKLLDETPDVTPVERGRLMVAYGMSLKQQDDPQAGFIQVEEGYELISGAVPEHHPERFRPLMLLIGFHAARSNNEPASHYGRTLLDALIRPVPEGTAIENPERLGWAELNHGAVVAETGQRKQAKQVSTAGIDRLRAHYGERTAGFGVALDMFSHVCLRNRDIPCAQKASTEAMDLLDDEAVEFWAGSEVDIVTGMARVMRAKKKKKEALKLFKRAALLASLKVRDVPRYIAYSQCYLYAALKESGHHEEAARIQQAAIERARTTLPPGNRTLKVCEDGTFSGY